MDTCGNTRAEWVAELERGPFKSRSHLINHIDMLFPTNSSPEALSDLNRFALIRTDEEPEWRSFDAFHDGCEVRRARDHVLAHSHNAATWSQVEIAVALKPEGDPDWDARVSTGATREDKLAIVIDAIDAWAEIVGIPLEDMMDSSSCFVLILDWDSIVLDRVAVNSFGTTEIPLKENDRKMMQLKHGDSDSWKAFAVTICAQDVVKAELMSRQKGVCPVCGEKIASGPVVHHVDYDHRCVAMEENHAQDCEKCLKAHPEWAAECLSRLRLVHMHCNKSVESY